MFVRVYDKENNRYYKSMVYARIGIGAWHGMIVFDPLCGAFVMSDIYDKTDNYKPICATINANTENFVTYEKAYMLKIKKCLRGKASVRKIDENTDYLYFHGYADVLENVEFVASLLRGEKIPLLESGINLRKNEDAETWNYVKTQKDADDFMALFAGFHDAYIKKITYEEITYPVNIATAYAIFESCWYGTVELCFEAVSELRLRPAGENYSGEIYDATLLANDERVFWADDFMEEENMDHGGCAIRAINLKWRTLEENRTVNF